MSAAYSAAVIGLIDALEVYLEAEIAVTDEMEFMDWEALEDVMAKRRVHLENVMVVHRTLKGMSLDYGLSGIIPPLPLRLDKP